MAQTASPASPRPLDASLIGVASALDCFGLWGAFSIYFKLQFLLAVALYREPFTLIHLAAFGCIWLALALYSTDAWFTYRPRPPWATASRHGVSP